MGFRSATVDSQLGAVDGALGALTRVELHKAGIQRMRADLSAARFHLRRPGGTPPIVAILGGTGTGKSTLLNRLLNADVAAASFRRTFTAGPIAVTAAESSIPAKWLGVPHLTLAPAQLPARGQLDQLMIVIAPSELTTRITLIDTPDLDGDQPSHHAQADRVFRWADAVLFLVTPEKYQMTELLPYYRLAQRYGVPALHVMNKAEEHAAVADYQQQSGIERVFAIPRDDAAYEPPGESNLDLLRQSIESLKIVDQPQFAALRVIDLMDRMRDQLLEPLRNDRREVDRLIATLRAMETPPPGVDVNPLTQQLQRRLQQRSVLYLMGPGRMFDRVRQVPGMLARLPRTTWDLLRTGRLSPDGDDVAPTDLSRDKPNFRAAMVDQFAVVQSRIDDAIRSNPVTLAWQEHDSSPYAASKLNPDLAGQIADDEIAQLQNWLETQWNATPRDTAIIEKMLKLLPGGKQLTKWSEAAPYLLAVVVATHHVFFGHIDLLILGGFSLATWLSEKLSNQVAARTRQANNAIASRFSDLAHKQIEQTCAWLNGCAASTREIENLTVITDQISESLQGSAPTVQAENEGMEINTSRPYLFPGNK
jgi:hypothetical protein